MPTVHFAGQSRAYRAAILLGYIQDTLKFFALPIERQVQWDSIGFEPITQEFYSLIAVRVYMVRVAGPAPAASRAQAARSAI